MSMKTGFTGGFVEEIDVSRSEVVRRCWTLVFARFAIAFLLLIVHLAWPEVWARTEEGGEQIGPLGAFFWVYALVAVLLVVATAISRKKKPLTKYGLVVDLIAATAMVALTGGAASKFVLLYMLIIVGSAVLLSPLTGVAVGIASVTLLSVTHLGVSSGWWVQPPEAAYSTSPVFGFIAVISFLMLTAFLSGYLGLKGTRLKVLNVELLESINAGIAIVDLDGTLQYLNTTGGDLLGIDVAKARGTRVEDTVLINGAANPFCDTLEKRRPLFRLEVSLKTHHGQVIPAGITTSILRDRTGRIWGVLGTFVDLTEAKRIEERLRHADRMGTLAQLAAGMGHDIRTPLACIMGAVELLKEIRPDSTETQEVADILVRETGRLSGIVENFLDISRISTPRCCSFRFRSLWEEVESVLAARLQNVKDGRVELSASWTPPDLALWADFGQMRQAVLNLVQNGAEAVLDRGRVDVSSEVSRKDGRHGAEEGVQIVVQDTGPGIPDDVKDKIFEPFYTSKAKGTGLGLAVVKRIVEGHGGEVRVVEAVDAGTAFRLWIPTEDG